MCVKYVRFAAIRTACSTACSRLKCVGCRRRRRALRTSTSSPSNSGQEPAGISLASVQYAKSPMRKPRIGRWPWRRGIGVMRITDSTCVFAREILPQQTGRIGYAVRVAPNHFDDPLTRPCHPLLKWATGGAKKGE